MSAPGCHRRHFHLSIVNNYTKSNLSQLKLNNSSTTLSVCGLEWLYLTISAKLQSHHTSATNLIPLLQSFSYKERPSSYWTQVSLVIKALNTQNGSFKYLLRKVWTIGDTDGVIISLNHLEEKSFILKTVVFSFFATFFIQWSVQEVGVHRDRREDFERLKTPSLFWRQLLRWGRETSLNGKACFWVLFGFQSSFEKCSEWKVWIFSALFWLRSSKRCHLLICGVRTTLEQEASGWLPLSLFLS